MVASSNFEHPADPAQTIDIYLLVKVLILGRGENIATILQMVYEF